MTDKDVTDLGTRIARAVALVEDRKWAEAVAVVREADDLDEMIAALVGALVATLTTVARISGESLDGLLLRMISGLESPDA